MIWLTGNQGLLGSEIEKALKRRSLNYFASDKEIDITDAGAVVNALKINKPSWIINCAAYTNVEKAESEKEAAFRINARGVENLAKASAELKGIKIIHFSTDYVFDGKKNTPYLETDSPLPLSVYGKSKLLGEEYLQKHAGLYYIIRTSWLYGLSGDNFVKKIIYLLKNKDRLKIINDQHGTPAYAKDLAAITLEFIEKNPDFGIYHFANQGETTWYYFGLEVYNQLKDAGKINGNIIIEPVSAAALNTKAVRPSYSVLSKEKIKKALNGEIRTWEEALGDFIKEVRV